MIEPSVKPKRKPKPKHISRRHWIVLFVLFVLAVVSQIMVSVVDDIVTEAVISSELCDMDVDYPYLIHDDDTYRLEIGNLNSQEISKTFQAVSDVRWFESGQEIIYRQIQGSETATFHWYDLTTTDELQSDLKHQHYYYGFTVSPSGNYIAVLEPGSYKLEKETYVIDTQTSNVISNQTIWGEFHSWSTSGRFILYRYGLNFTDYLIDVVNNRIVYLNFPSYPENFLGWFSDTTLVYTNSDGDFMEFDLSTDPPEHTISDTYRVEIDDHSIETIEINWIESGKRLLVVDEHYQYWLVDLVKQTYSRQPEIDYYQQHYFGYFNNVITPDEYDTSVHGPKEFEVTELTQGRKLRLKNDNFHSHSVSRSGDFLLVYEHIANDINGKILSFDKPLQININELRSWQWLVIEDQDYLYFSQRTDFNSYHHTHYLYNPDTQSACVVTISTTRGLIWQPQN